MIIQNILEYLETTLLTAPDRIAFEDERTSLSFACLENTARSVGSAIMQYTKPRQPVVILMNDRSVECVIAMLGVLYAGCCYVPLDANLPAERLKLIAGNLKPALVLHDDKNAGCTSSFSCATLSYEQASIHKIDCQGLRDIRAQSTTKDPMAIMFTSGSTGIPKGVVQSMQSHIRYTQATIDQLNFTDETIFGNQSPFFYANSIIDIFPTLALGAKTIILPAAALSFPTVLLEQLNTHRISELTMTPSSYVKVASSGVLSEGSLPHLEYIILSGEAAHWTTLEKWLQAAPNGNVWNFYGSTELYSVAIWRLNRRFDDASVIPVGPLYKGVEIRFFDEDGQTSAPGTPGEMTIHTPWMADGYYHDPERTMDAFVTMEDGRRFYHTGDLGLMDDDQHLVVLGRKDTQIKHMGYRMEIGETEQALLAVEGVAAGCCLFDKESGILHCFYAGHLTPKELMAELKKKLPRYAIADKFHHLPQMPYTSNNKIDRQKLRQLF